MQSTVIAARTANSVPLTEHQRWQWKNVDAMAHIANEAVAATISVVMIDEVIKQFSRL